MGSGEWLAGAGREILEPEKPEREPEPEAAAAAADCQSHVGGCLDPAGGWAGWGQWGLSVVGAGVRGRAGFWGPKLLTMKTQRQWTTSAGRRRGGLRARLQQL